MLKTSIVASMDTELIVALVASDIFARLYGRFCDIPKLSVCIKTFVYRACVCSTLPYGSKIWSLLTVKDKKISIFHKLGGK